MAVEIERKFLVAGTGWRQAGGQAVHLSQGYLNRDKARTVRVRQAGAQAFLTIKGATVGATRAEFEYEIPVADARQLLALCEGPVVEKIRHVIAHGGATWEVDEFLGENAGLVVAEIELRSEDQAFERPPWLGAEVTHDPRYFNSSLAARPYGTWAAQAAGDIRPAVFPQDLEHVIDIFQEYVRSPSVSLDFQEYGPEFATLPGKYAAPDGRLLLAWQEGAVVGCAALRRVDERTCEMKRVYVRPAARGAQLGRQLVERILDEARAAGYARICLDVLPEFTAAQRLYASLGFRPAPPVSFNPVPGTQFLGLDLV